MIEDPLWAAVRAARMRWGEPKLEFPSRPKWEPLAGTEGAQNLYCDEWGSLPVPTEATVPTPGGEEGGDIALAGGVGSGDWEERAGILEAEAGLSRADAEHQATAEIALRGTCGCTGP